MNKLIYNGENIKNMQYTQSKNSNYVNPKSNILLKSPLLTTFGVSEYEGNKYISFMLDNSEFLENILLFENEIKEHLQTHFGNKTMEMSPIVKYSKTSNLPSFKIKIGKTYTMFDENRKQLYPTKNNEMNPLDYIMNYSKVNVMIQFNGFFVPNNDDDDNIAYPMLTLSQIKITKPFQYNCDF